MANSVQDWLDALEDVDDATREEAAKALTERADPKTLEPLLVALEDDFWSVRSHVGWALAKIGGDKAIEGLITLFNDTMLEVQAEAIQAMTSMGSGVIPTLLTCLKDKRWRVREQAAKTLGKLHDSQAVKGLIVVCRDRDGAVKSAAAEALGSIGDPQAVPTLIKLFKDTSKIIRETAGTALMYIGIPSVDALLETLKDPHFVVRCHGVRALGGMTTDYQMGKPWVRESRVVDALVAMVKDPDRAVREDATIALGNIGDPGAIDALIESMKDGSVKRHAIASLGMIGDPRALPPVLDALKGKGIHQAGKPTPGCIISEELLIKEAAATALGHFRHPRVIPDLVFLLKDLVLRDYASNSLVLIGDAAIEPLVSFFHDPDLSKVEKESERVLNFATTRMTAAGALKSIVLGTLDILGWKPLAALSKEIREIEYTDTLNVLGVGGEGRFGKSGDIAQPAKAPKIER